MAKKQTKSATQIAQQGKPGWKSVESTPGVDSVPTTPPDAQTPELKRLRQKYFGAGDNTNASATPSNDATLVVMEPKTASDSVRVDRKRFVVDKQKITGEQG